MKTSINDLEYQIDPWLLEIAGLGRIRGASSLDLGESHQVGFGSISRSQLIFDDANSYLDAEFKGVQLEELATCLNSRPLDDFDPKPATSEEFLYASCECGLCDRTVEVILSEWIRIRREDDFMELHVNCGFGHVGSICWTQDSGWALPRKSHLTAQSERDQSVARRIKEMYDYQCQACGQVLETPVGRVAEAAHVWEDHDGGPDLIENLLCLCPNCHATFDARAWHLEIHSELPRRYDTLRKTYSALSFNEGHCINQQFIERRGRGLVAA